MNHNQEAFRVLIISIKMSEPKEVKQSAGLRWIKTGTLFTSNRMMPKNSLLLFVWN